MFGQKNLKIVCGGTTRNNSTVRQTRDIKSKVDLDSINKASAGPIAELLTETGVYNGYVHIMDGSKKVAQLNVNASDCSAMELCR